MSTASSTSAQAVPLPSVPWQTDAKPMALVGMAHATSHFTHLLLPPLFPIFMREFGLNFADVGSLMTLFFIISGVGQALAGFVVDRLGARPVLFLAIGCFLLASVVAANAQGYAGLALVSILAGLGNAPFHPVDFTILNQRVSPARLGHAYSTHGLTGNLGWALAPVFFVSIANLSHWRTAYWLAAALYVGVLGILAFNRQHLATTVAPRTSSDSAANDMAFLKLPVVWWCFAFFLLSTMTLAVVQSFAPSILERAHHIDPKSAAYTVSAYMVFGAIGMFVGGLVAARKQAVIATPGAGSWLQPSTWSSDRIVAASMASGTVLILLCSTGWLGGTGTMAVLAITGFAIGVGGPNRDMMIKKATPPGATGRVYGTVYSGLDIGFALSPLIYGHLMDKGWYATTLVGAAASLALSVLVALGVGQRTPIKSPSQT